MPQLKKIIEKIWRTISDHINAISDLRRGCPDECEFEALSTINAIKARMRMRRDYEKRGTELKSTKSTVRIKKMTPAAFTDLVKSNSVKLQYTNDQVRQMKEELDWRKLKERGRKERYLVKYRTMGIQLVVFGTLVFILLIAIIF